MLEKISMRSFKMKDCTALENIIREAWNYDDFSSEKAATKLAKTFLSNCLTNQTFAQVVLVNGEVAGIIMGKNRQRHKCPLKFRLHKLICVFSLLISKEGRKVSSIFKDVNKIDKTLFENCHKEYQGEVSFFAINAKYRGKGLGKQLFNKLITYMKSENIQNFFLFTDTSCNYRFYEHQGMVRRGCQKHSFLINGKNVEMQFFIYDYQC